MILFSVYDRGVNLVSDPHLAPTEESAKLSLGRTFVENQALKDRVDTTELVILGEWDPTYGITSLMNDHYMACDCIDLYMKEVAKQNEEAVSNSDGSI